MLGCGAHSPRSVITTTLCPTQPELGGCLTYSPSLPRPRGAQCLAQHLDSRCCTALRLPLSFLELLPGLNCQQLAPESKHLPLTGEQGLFSRCFHGILLVSRQGKQLELALSREGIYWLTAESRAQMSCSVFAVSPQLSFCSALCSSRAQAAVWQLRRTAITGKPHRKGILHPINSNRSHEGARIRPTWSSPVRQQYSSQPTRWLRKESVSPPCSSQPPEA